VNNRSIGKRDDVNNESLLDSKQSVDEPVAGDSVEYQEEELSLEDRLAIAEAKAAEYLDGWQRARAEFANARKRSERNRAEVRDRTAIDYASQLLPILDDFQRAVENVPAAIEADSWFEGIILVKRKIDTILDGLKVQPIEALGRDFDPNFHEALAQIDADGVESGIVLEVLQTGYQLKDRVIRPALVNVAA